MSAEHDPIKPKFPLWPYLNQPLFSPEFKSLNPFRFWQLYNLEQLEAAWQKSHALESEQPDRLIAFLENCWLKHCWHTDPRLKELHFKNSHLVDDEFVRFLERCWARSLSKSKGYFDPEFRSDEEDCY